MNRLRPGGGKDAGQGTGIPGEGLHSSTNQLNPVNFAGDLIVAVGNGGTVVTSPNGVIWTAPIAVGTPVLDSALVKVIPLDDTDGDGLPDEWEAHHGLRPDDPSDAATDTDHDGASNLAEYQAGTDCQDAQSVLKLRIDFTPIRTLRFDAVSNQTYTVQSTDV